MADQDLVFRVVVLVLFIGVRFVRWHARRLVGWQASWPAMKKYPLDTVVLLSLALAWLTAVVVFVACPASGRTVRGADPRLSPLVCGRRWPWPVWRCCGGPIAASART